MEESGLAEVRAGGVYLKMVDRQIFSRNVDGQKIRTDRQTWLGNKTGQKLEPLPFTGTQELYFTRKE